MVQMRKLSLLLLILLFSIVQKGFGQLGPMYSQYMFNTFLLNPAAAGSEGYTAINLTGRNQWLGLPGAPQTQAISAQTRILKNSFIAKALNLRKKYSKRSKSGRVGIGAFFFNDINGNLRQTGGQVTYAYHIPLRQSQLSFGLSLSGYQKKIDKPSVNLGNNNNDPFFNSNSFNRGIVDANMGIQYSAPLYYAGFAVTNLMQNSLNFSQGLSNDFLTTRQYILTGGYKFEVNRFVLIEPTTLIKYSEPNALQLDITARAYYREDYWGGLSYRTGANAGSLIFLVGVRVNKYYFGYAFDYTFAAIGANTLGSHEIMLALKFGENARRYRWLNRY